MVEAERVKAKEAAAKVAFAAARVSTTTFKIVATPITCKHDYNREKINYIDMRNNLADQYAAAATEPEESENVTITVNEIGKKPESSSWSLSISSFLHCRRGLSVMYSFWQASFIAVIGF